jgi:hypothetical protein
MKRNGRERKRSQNGNAKPQEGPEGAFHGQASICEDEKIFGIAKSYASAN